MPNILLFILILCFVSKVIVDQDLNDCPQTTDPERKLMQICFHFSRKEHKPRGCWLDFPCQQQGLRVVQQMWVQRWGAVDKEVMKSLGS